MHSPALPHRLLVAFVSLSLVLGFGWSPRPAQAATGDPVLLNEILASTTGADVEFVELYGTPGTSLGNLSLIVVEGDAVTTQGLVTFRLDLAGQVIGGNNFFLAGTTSGLQDFYDVTPNVDFTTGALQNGTETFALVTTASAPALGDQLSGSEVVKDSLAMTDGGTGDTTYLGAPVFGPDGTFFPAGAHRLADGVDTDTAGDWALADFSLASTTNPNTPTTGTALDNQPVVADCGDDLQLVQGDAGSTSVSATDADGTVSAIEISDVSPATDAITLTDLAAATEPGGTATATVSVDGAIEPGSYEVTVSATNTDAEPQTDSCVLSVDVLAVTTIGAVQGAVADQDDPTTHASPLEGDTVVVRGVISEIALARTSRGADNWTFYLQNTLSTDDNDPLSSDGVPIFNNTFRTIRFSDGSTPQYRPQVGDEVVVRARVSEFHNLTELGSPFIERVVRHGVDLGDELASVEANPSHDLHAAQLFWERHEGMLLTVPAGSLVTAPRDVFASTADGEVWVIRGDDDLAQRDDPYAQRVFRDFHPLDDVPDQVFDNENGERILLTSHGLKGATGDNTTLIAPARTFDSVGNALTGAVNYSFDKYGIEITEQPALTHGVDPADNAPPQPAVTGEEFATSDYNVENLYDYRDDPNDGCDFPDDTGCDGVSPPFDYVPASEADYQHHLSDLATQIAGPMHAPDILMIQEAEDQDICTVVDDALACGEADNADGRPDTLQELALTIADAGGPTYLTAYDRDGADDRGIVSAFMYRADSVELLPASADDPVLGSSPTVEYRGDALAYNAQVSNPKALNADLPSDVDTSTGVDGSNVYTRAPQVGHFRVWRDGIGQSVFTDLYAISNHFSSGPDTRVGQRTEQAAYNAAIVAALQQADPTVRVVSAGDFNVFPRPDDPFQDAPTDQLGPMYEAGLHNLFDVLVDEVPSSAYSYTFEGQAQTLDMQWATSAQFDDLVQIRAAHLNADYAADFDGDPARGASDHDPQVTRWNTDVTLDRLRALVDHDVAQGTVSAAKAPLLYDRLDRAARFLAAGQLGAYRSQLVAFGDQAQDLVPRWASAAAASALEAEADRLASL